MGVLPSGSGAHAHLLRPELARKPQDWGGGFTVWAGFGGGCPDGRERHRLFKPFPFEVKSLTGKGPGLRFLAEKDMYSRLQAMLAQRFPGEGSWDETPVMAMFVDLGY